MSIVSLVLKMYAC